VRVRVSMDGGGPVPRAVRDDGMIEGPCRMCGESGKRSPLQEHHINTDWKDDHPNNKTVLCAKCHKKIHLLHGPSKRPHVSPLLGDKLESAKLRFDKKYGHKGGYIKLERLCADPTKTLYDVAHHFGPRSDSAAYCWVKKFGLKWSPVVSKYNIYSKPYNGTAASA